ncbi:MAG: hypothetical protein HY014_11950 [Acidobacteria bacterium]|nr:hypothetical protein [Acidobacteriota bacterium]MBI3488868.1 hypothetical protein [Acidobacteriota bacterium]
MRMPFICAGAAWVWVSALLVLGSACKRPETALREKGAQGIELVQKVPGMTPEEEKAMVARLGEGLGVPVDPAKARPDPTRIFRLTLSGKTDPNAGRDRRKTVLVSTGYGALFGALCPAAAFTYWQTLRSAAIAAGAGGILGLGYGPIWYQHNQETLKELGYLPWHFEANWEVLERSREKDDVVASRWNQVPFGFGLITPTLDLRPHLRPLPPESRSEADIRQACLRAYADALLEHLRKRGVQAPAASN